MLFSRFSINLRFVKTHNNFFSTFTGGGVNPFRQDGNIGEGGGYSYRSANPTETNDTSNVYAYNIKDRVYQFRNKDVESESEDYPYKCRSQDEYIRQHFKLYNDILSSYNGNVKPSSAVSAARSSSESAW